VYCVPVFAVHFAYTVLFALTVVEYVNCVPPPFVAVHHPPKLYPLLVGSVGIFADPTEAPLFTVRVWVPGLPPSALNVTVYCVPVFAVHFAYTVLFALTDVEYVNCVPPPFVAVHHPPKLYPLLVGSVGIFADPTEAPLSTVRVWVAGLPPSALNVTVYRTIVHLAYTALSAVTAVVAVNSVPPPFRSVYQPPKV
jgi:hypothetical protein